MKPQLVIGENNQVCMQIRLGQFSATLPLPDELAAYTEAQLKPYFDRVVPEVTKKLIAARNAHNRKLRKKACRSGSLSSAPSSPARTLRALPSE